MCLPRGLSMAVGVVQTKKRGISPIYAWRNNALQLAKTENIQRSFSVCACSASCELTVPTTAAINHRPVKENPQSFAVKYDLE
jgi:hypothetical protein